MAVTVTEVAKNLTVAATSTTITGVSANVGDVLVAVVNISAGNATKISSSVADPGGNTWTKQQTSLGSNGNATRAEIWTAPCTVALSAATITIQFNSQSVTAMLRILTVTGVTVTGLLGNNDNLNGAVGTTHTSVTVSPTGAACVIGTITYNGTNPPTAGPGTGWTALTGGSPISGCYGAAGYDVVGAAGTFGPAWTTGNTSSGAVTISLPQGGTPATGSAALTLAASGTATGAATGPAAITLAASGTAVGAATGSVAFTVAASGTATATATGAATLSLAASGTAQAAATGTAALALAATGTSAASVTGAATLTVTVTGTATAAATGTAALTVSTAGTAAAAATGTVSLDVTTSGDAAAVASGAATLTLTADGTGTGRSSGTATLTITAVGTATATAVPFDFDFTAVRPAFAFTSTPPAAAFTATPPTVAATTGTPVLAATAGPPHAAFAAAPPTFTEA